MNPAVAIIDTNVIVSALITADPSASVCQVLDGMLSGGFVYLLSPDLLAEYRQILLRPRLVQIHGLTPAEVDRLLEELVANAVWREPAHGTAAPDPGDNHLWSLLLMQPGAVLVTGDKLLIDQAPVGSNVVLPRTFIDRQLV